MSNDIEQAMLPKFDPLSTFYSQMYALQRAEDAYANAAIALNMLQKLLNTITSPNGIGLRVFETLSQAVAWDYGNVQIMVYCQGRDSKGDSLGGFWLYDPASLDTPNGYSIIAPTTLGATGNLLKQL